MLSAFLNKRGAPAPQQVPPGNGELAKDLQTDTLGLLGEALTPQTPEDDQGRPPFPLSGRWNQNSAMPPT